MQIDSSTRALITGASRGIGSATATAFARRGVKVGLLAHPSNELEKLSASLEGSVALPSDVADQAQVESAVKEFLETAGGIDILVANAGVAFFARAQELPTVHVEQMVRVNYLGTVHAVQAVLPVMLERSRGHIVIVSSATAHRSFPAAGAYGASKAAQRAFAEALHHDLDGTGVSVTTVYPGRVATSLHDHDRGRMPSWYERGPRPLDAGTVSEAIVNAVERDRRHLFIPRSTRLMAALHGISPALADGLIRLIMGPTAAPRRREI